MTGIILPFIEDTATLQKSIDGVNGFTVTAGVIGRTPFLNLRFTFDVGSLGDEGDMSVTDVFLKFKNANQELEFIGSPGITIEDAGSRRIVTKGGFTINDSKVGGAGDIPSATGKKKRRRSTSPKKATKP